MKHKILVIAQNHADAVEYVKNRPVTDHLDYNSVDLDSSTIKEDVSNGTELVIILAPTTLLSVDSVLALINKIRKVLTLPQLAEAKMALLTTSTSNATSSEMLTVQLTVVSNPLMISSYFSQKELDEYMNIAFRNSDLLIIKDLVSTNLSAYISDFKLSIFGHHHNGRAKQILNAIHRATTQAQIDQCLQSQVDLFTHASVNPGTPYTTAKTDFFVDLALNSDLLTQVKNAPKMDKDGNLISGYLHAITNAQEQIRNYRNQSTSTTKPSII